MAGPAGGLIVSNDADIAERLDPIAFPGMTANFDAAKSAALAITMLDWREHGNAYGAAMVELAQALASGARRQWHTGSRESIRLHPVAPVRH